MPGQNFDMFPAHHGPMTTNKGPARSDAANRGAGEIGAANAAVLKDMLSLLSSQRPDTHSDALKLLRDGFPAEPLARRVAACAAFTKDGDPAS